jgi:hypothetical protein
MARVIRNLRKTDWVRDMETWQERRDIAQLEEVLFKLRGKMETKRPPPPKRTSDFEEIGKITMSRWPWWALAFRYRREKCIFIFNTSKGKIGNCVN